MTDVNRLAIPSLPSARTRSKFRPKPFARKSITINASIPPAERREWTTVAVTDIKVGDIVPGVGRVFEVKESIHTPRAHSGLTAAEIADQISWTVTIKGGVSNERIYQGNDTVWAFTSGRGHR